MLIDALTYPLQNCEELQPFWARLDAGEDATCGIAQSARPFMVAARFTRTPQPTLVVVPAETGALEFIRQLRSYLDEDKVLPFPLKTRTPWDEHAEDPACVAKRFEALYALTQSQDIMVVASAQALLHKLPPRSAELFKPLIFKRDSVLPAGIEHYEDLCMRLEDLGYENTGELEGPGSFTTQAGTIDIFPGNLPYPVRLDFFGDELDDIRRIVPSTGQTIKQLERVAIFPVRDLRPSKRALAHARDVLHNPAKTNPILREMLEKLEQGTSRSVDDALLPYLYKNLEGVGDYVGSDALTVLIEPRSIFDDALRAADELTVKAEGTSIPMEAIYFEAAKLDFGNNQRAMYQSIMSIGASLDTEMPVKRTDVAGDPEKLFGKLRNLIEADFTVVLCASHLRSREEVKFELVDRSIPIVEHLDATAEEHGPLKRGVVNISDVDIPIGFILPKAKLALISLADTQGSGAIKVHKRVDVTDITFPYAPGDYVVHASHGVAFFRELTRRNVDGVERDYLLLEYAEDDKLFVPVEQFDRVTRYVGPEGGAPRLTRLNTSDWSRALNKARKATRKLAFDLVDVYARRAATRGFAFSADTPWQKQMEEDFPYSETTDQLAAIADVKADMQAARPMDRLICGDVGFGKTEVALRAAFKATQDAKQVMVLCPTTILTQQHYTTFTDRFEPYGVEVEVLSRFRTPAQQSAALEGFSQGRVDVLIGTHRLLSRDVNPHDLGLVIIDEEQRFGVGHKEQLKNLRESIDVLTLSATPIPRTMQMGLSGVRDMSLILTPPDDRLPVEVHVGEWDSDIISDAIGRELHRGGQVYYVSNRVRSMNDALDRVSAAAPTARVAVAHGQMSKDELERVMEDFAAGTIDVLVATTIIESGIDNPHTNTLIIEDSQRLGLAQMYQLKGRVGRSNRQAYAYFLFPEQVNLTEEAMARLLAIDEHQDLGSGMRVAMRDLEIRGAGTLLGAEQSGNMSAVGFDLFASMLATAVQATREGKAETADMLPPALSDITVNVPEHAYIPEDYIRDTDERVLLYRKVASADSITEVKRLQNETLARHGAMPQACVNYFMKAEVKALANEAHIKAISVVAGKLNIEPIVQPTGETWADLHRMKARYISSTKKLQIPLKYFALEEDGSLLEAIRDFLLALA